MAKKKTPTWLIGCGIGCGALILGFLILVGLGVAWTRSTTQGFEEAVRARSELEERFGEPGDFTPPPDGSVPPERMEAFLSVREATQPAREKIAATFSKMPLSEEEAREMKEKPFTEKVGQVLGILGSAMEMPSDLGAFLRSRNEALKDAGMSMGEYSYIYSLAYYALLGNAPGDGPGDRPGEGSRRADRGRIQVAGARASSSLRSDMERILRNQLAAVPEQDGTGLRAAVAAELEKMAADGDHLPWLDGLPDPIRASLEPYAERLQATYQPVTNGFELARVRKRGAMSFTAD